MATSNKNNTDPNAEFGPTNKKVDEEQPTTAEVTEVQEVTLIEELLAGLEPLPEGTDMSPYNAASLPPIPVKEDKDTQYVLLSGCIAGIDTETKEIRLVTGVYFRFPSIPKGWGSPKVSFVEHIQNHNATPYFRISGGANFDASVETLISGVSEKAKTAVDKFILSSAKKLTDIPFMGNALGGDARKGITRKVFRVKLEEKYGDKVPEDVLTRITETNYSALNKQLAGQVFQKQLSGVSDIL